MQGDRESSPAAGPSRQGPFHKFLSLVVPKIPPPSITEDHLLCILEFRRGREAAFGRDLFADPAWDLLLELYTAKLSGQRTTSDDLTRAIGLPQSTVARWIRALEARRLVVSRDRSDPGQAPIELSCHGERQLKRLMDYWARAFRSI